MRSSEAAMAPRVQSDEAVKGKVAKMTAKKSSAEKSSPGNPSYKDMVIEAIMVQKEKSGSSLDGIKKFLGSKYHIDVAKQAGLLNRCLEDYNSGIMICYIQDPEEDARRGGARARCSGGKEGIRVFQAVFRGEGSHW